MANEYRTEGRRLIFQLRFVTYRPWLFEGKRRN